MKEHVQLSLFVDSIEKPVLGKKVITIRHNADYHNDTVEVLDGTVQLCVESTQALDPRKLAEILRWFGHPVRIVDYMFEHDIAEFG